jgi:Kef-type K+ transport system membrane component KefB
MQDALAHVLLALLVVLMLGRVLGHALGPFGQPPIIGEGLAGILLGPSFLGRLWPAGEQYLLPPTIAPYLAVVAQLGVILYMFLVGLELQMSTLKARAAAILAISQCGILVPFVGVAGLGYFLFPRFANPHVGMTSFVLFLGVAGAVTAFPVLARILTDRDMHRTPLGILALMCAAAADVTAWCLLALVVGVAQERYARAFVVLGLAVLYIVVMLFIVRRLIMRYVSNLDEKKVTSAGVTVAMAALLLSSLSAELIGIHAVFGAFLLGLVMPSNDALSETLARKIEGVVTVLLLPAFFAITGMRTEIELLQGDAWLVCGLITLVASGGKLAGTLVPARLSGMTWRDSTALGVLMNTRGLMELIVLNIGLDLNIISPALFAIMVVMALLATMATGPALQLLVGGWDKHKKSDNHQGISEARFPIDQGGART